MHHSNNGPFYCKSMDKAMGYIDNRFKKLEEMAKSISDPYVRDQQIRNLKKTKKRMADSLDVIKGIKC
jgi:hypothetical protein